jgi:hypothetical protein
MCITAEEATCTTDDSGAAAVGIVGAGFVVFGFCFGVFATIMIGVAIIGIAAWMITRKM